MNGDRGFRRKALGIGVISTLVFGWFLTIGRGDLFAHPGQGNLFDIQARSILDGQLHAESGAYHFEGFVVQGRTYTYFGIFPSLLRIPLFVFTDHYDGRLTGVSMLMAYLIAMAATVVLIERVRQLARPGEEWTRTGETIALILVAVVGLGSNLVFLAGSAWVYSEAELWGCAGALACFAALVGFLLRPERHHLIAVAGLWATIAWLSRGSVGAGPSVALGLMGLAYLWNWKPLRLLAPFPDDGWSRSWRRGGGLLAASVLPALAFAAVNLAKFRTLSTPFQNQVWSELSSHRQEVLEEYGGNLFSFRLVLPNLIQWLRPDLLRPSGLWPFVDYTGRPPPRIGGVVFDTVEPSAGLVLTAPFLVIVALWGGVAVLRQPRLSSLRPLLIGGGVAACVPLTIAFVAQRYLTDAVPLLVTAACAGVIAMDRSDWRRPRLWLGALGTAAVIGIYVTLSVTWVSQRFVAPMDAAAETAGWRARASVADVVGSDVPFDQVRGLGSREAKDHNGELVVVGDCDGLYRGKDDDWFPLETTEELGHYAATLELDDALPDHETVAVLAVSEPGADDNRDGVLTIGLEADDESGPDRVRFRVLSGRKYNSSLGKSFTFEPRVSHSFDAWIDPNLRFVRIEVDGMVVYNLVPSPTPLGEVDWGTNPYGGRRIEEDFPGEITPHDIPTPTCDALTGN